MRRWLCFLWLVTALQLTGCGSARFTSTLPPSRNPALAIGDVQFHLASFQLENQTKSHPTQGMFDPIRDLVPNRAKELFPKVFTNDWEAIPLSVSTTGTYSDSMIGAMLTGFTIGVIPFPTSTMSDFRVVTSLVDERGDKLPITPVTFQRKDVFWLTLVGPLGCIPIFGESLLPRDTIFLMIGAESAGIKGTQLSVDSLVEAVVSGVRTVEPARLAAIARARQARLREVTVEGTRYWSFLAPFFSQGIAKQERADRFVALLYREKPRRDLQPAETVTVAKRSGDGRWQPVTGYLRLAKGLVAVNALMEDGVPSRLLLTEQSEPLLDDFIALPEAGGSDQEIAVATRWSNRILLQAKNKSLTNLFKTKATGELLDLVTQIENAVLDLNRLTELTKDRAQQVVEKGGDAAPQRELALVYRERIDVLRPLLGALKQEVAARGGK